MDFSAIQSHPNCDEIVKKLLTGTEPAEVHQWLKLKYPKADEKHLIISLKLLTDFNKSEYLNLYNQFAQDKMAVKGLTKTMSPALANNKAYHERLMEIAEKELDIKNILRGSLMMAQDRSVQLFDLIQENPAKYSKGEYTLIKWIEIIFSGCEKYDKLINRSPDTIIQHNHSIEYIDQTAAIFQEAVKEVFAEVDTELALLLMDKISAKMAVIRPLSEETPMSLNQIEGQITQFSEKVKGLNGE